MKQVLLAILVAIICIANTDAQSDKILIQFEPYTEIELNGNFDVLLVPGEKEEVLIEGQEHRIEDLIVEQNKERIIIGPKVKRNLKGFKKVQLTISFKKLEELELNGVGEIRCDRQIVGDRLTIQSNGIKNIRFDLDVRYLIANFDGIGNAYLAGHADIGKIQFNGIGNLRAFDLEIKDLRVMSSGIGNAEVCATEELSAHASGIGSLRYKGSPTVKHIDGSGIGKIQRVD